MIRFKMFLWFVPLVAFAVIVVLYGTNTSIPGQDEPPEPRQAVTEAMRDLISGEFSLVDHTGRAVTDESYRGEWLLVFFGYTHCPDICPTTMATVALVLDALGEDAAKLRPLFVTVDPARDTTKVLAEYVAAFHPRIVGLTGTGEQVAAAAKSHSVFYEKAPLVEGGEIHADDYAMVHAAHLYLMDSEGVYAARFSPIDTVETIAAGVRRFLSR